MKIDFDKIQRYLAEIKLRHREIEELFLANNLADYEDLQKDVQFEVSLKSEKNYFAVEKELSASIDKLAHLEGILPETLVNLWLKEKEQEKELE